MSMHQFCPVLGVAIAVVHTHSEIASSAKEIFVMSTQDNTRNSKNTENTDASAPAVVELALLHGKRFRYDHPNPSRKSLKNDNRCFLTLNS